MFEKSIVKRSVSLFLRSLKRSVQNYNAGNPDQQESARKRSKVDIVRFGIRKVRKVQKGEKQELGNEVENNSKR